MSKPVRMRRTQWKHWICPVGAEYCGRPSKYGNPYTVKEYGRAGCLKRFRRMLRDKKVREEMNYPSDKVIQKELKGKNLICWCGLNEDCHVNDLLRIANK